MCFVFDEAHLKLRTYVSNIFFAKRFEDKCNEKKCKQNSCNDTGKFACVIVPMEGVII